MNVNGVPQLLADMRAMADRAAGQPAGTASQGVDFPSMLQSALQQVNGSQQESDTLQKQFATGESGVDLQDVMMSMQKASLSFQTLVQVRNRLVAAYQEVLNMQV